MSHQKRQRNLYGEEWIRSLPGYYDPYTPFYLRPLRRESAYMNGKFVLNLFTLRLRTKNVIYLVLMFLFGVIPAAALIALFLLVVIPGMIRVELTFTLSPYWLILLPGLLAPFFLSANLLINILEIIKIRRHGQNRDKKGSRIRSHEE
jgi:hypothetical protein